MSIRHKDPLETVKYIRMGIEHEKRDSKRAVWQSIQQHMPELAALIPEINAKLGPITAISVTPSWKGEPWRKREWKR